MALKLLTALTVVIFVSFSYKVWDKTKVSWKVPTEDVWKVKTIEFAHRISQKTVSSGIHAHTSINVYNITESQAQ